MPKQIVQKMLEEIRNRIQYFRCPSCGYEYTFDDVPLSLVTYWGEDGWIREECPACELEFAVRECVERTYEVRLAKSGEDDEPL